MGNTTLRKALDDYKTIYMAYRNFAERTREEYLNDLQGLLKFLEKSGIKHVGEVGIPIIERYVAHLEQKGFASRTRKRKVVAIRSFLSFLYLEDYISTNIAIKIVLPFTENTTPHVLTQTECNQLRLACASNLRDAAIVELLLQTGIKLSELVNLTRNDVEFGETEKFPGFIRILGRRAKKSRGIPLNSKASIALKSYMDIRKAAASNILFLNRFDEPLGERGIQKMLRKYLKCARIGRANINTLRHTFGAHNIARGAELETIQEVMGLKDIRSTSIYQTLAKEAVSRELQENSI